MKKTFILILLFVLCFIAASLLMGIVAVYAFDGGALADSFRIFVMYSGSFILTIVGLAIFCRAKGWRVPSARPRPEKLNLPLILLALISIIAIDIVFAPLIELLPSANLDALYDMMSGGLWAVVTGVIAAPILEEFLFRGIVQENMVRFSNPFAGIIIASLIFGMVHLIPQQVIMATFSGLVIGTVFYLTGSLATAISIHMLNNGLAYTFFMYFGEEGTFAEIFGFSGATYVVIYGSCVVFLLGMVFLAVVRIKKRFKTERDDSRVADVA